MKLNNLFGNPELIKVSELRPYGHNAKHFEQSVYNDLEKSFKEFGDVGICLCDIDGVLIDGNTRLKFFKDNNIEFCYARKAIKKLTEKQVVRLNAILDNIGNKPDFSVIDVEILEEIKVDYDTVVVEIEEIKPEQLEAQEDDFEVPEGGSETDIVLGDLFELTANGLTHRLLCGDSTDSDSVAKLMNGEKADMVFTDPPYNINVNSISFNTKIENDNLSENDFKDFIQSVISNLFLFCKGSKYICFDIREKSFINMFYENGMKSLIVWVKDIGQHHRENYGVKYELIAYFEDGEFYGQNEENVWECKSIQSAGSKDDNGNLWFKGGSKGLTLHPTQKPILIPTRAINNSSKVNQLVLDLFVGSGSTMVAAHQLKRKCYGMELDSKYVEVIVQRMIKLDNTLVIKRNGIDETKKWLDKLA